MLKVTIDSFVYAEKEILKNVSFQLKKGEHLSVLGESGCGKSTLLHLIYGILNLEKGEITWNKKKLLGPKYNLIAGESFIKIVSQDLDLMPFTSVAENIAENLFRLDRKKDGARVDELLKVVGLLDFKSRKVKTLSGGQKQRVALAKALANKPELLLLDEPFSSIDTFRKNELRRELFGYMKENNISCITATHDSEEALAFSDKILMLKEGNMDMFASPENIYKNVNTQYQAGFFSEVTKLPKSLFASEEISENDNLSEEIVLLSHRLKLSEKKTNLKISVEKSYFKGKNYLVMARFNEKTVFFENPEKIEKNKQVYLRLDKKTDSK